MKSASASSRPRVGLLGNPSDAFGGHVIAFTFDDFRVDALCEPRAAGVILGAVGEEERVADGLADLAQRGAADFPGGAALLAAGVLEFDARWPGRLDAGLLLGFRSDVPRQVGLAGSSAILTAALRALARATGVEPAPHELAHAAWKAETERLGITAGPQDRVVQAYGGLVDMDFRRPFGPEAFERLAPELLPPLLVAWNRDPGESSGVAHSDVAARYRGGDAEVVAAVARFVSIADEGADALRARDHARMRELMDENFDTRARVWPLFDADHELVRIARERGAAAKLCGSGGAVVVAPPPGAEVRDALFQAYEAAGFGCVAPRIGREEVA